MQKRHSFSLQIRHKTLVFNMHVSISLFCIFICMALQIQIFRFQYTYSPISTGLHLYINNLYLCLYIHLYSISQMNNKQT